MYIKVRERYTEPKEKSRQNKLLKKERKENNNNITAATAKTKLIKADN